MALTGCNNHPTVKATYRCQQCGKPICDKCIVNNRFCSEVCNKKYSTFTATYKKPDSLKRSPWPSILFFLAVVGGLAYAAKYFGYWPK